VKANVQIDFQDRGCESVGNGLKAVPYTLRRRAMFGVLKRLSATLWLTPTTIQPARYVKLNAQVDF
jgi:hypothetical protein